MKQICGWCKKELDDSEISSESDSPISHGICRDCSFHILASTGMSLQEFLDGLPAPVVLVCEDATVLRANEEARTMLGKDASKIDGFRGGEVFECEYAYLPEGCGNTVHCSGCTIRITVMDTLNTGKSHSSLRTTYCTMLTSCQR